MKISCPVLNQKGFLLVSALMILLLLVAVSTVVFLVSTKDVRISGRIQGEKSAYTAAEGGVQQLLRCANANLGFFDACNMAMSQQLTASSPYTHYRIESPALTETWVASVPKQVSISGKGTSVVGYPSNKTITGTDTRFNTTVIVDVGVVCPSSSSTAQPAPETPCTGG